MSSTNDTHVRALEEMRRVAGMQREVPLDAALHLMKMGAGILAIEMAKVMKEMDAIAMQTWMLTIARDVTKPEEG